MLRIRKAGGGLIGRLAMVVAALVAVAVLAIALSAVHLLPQLRNPFAEKTTITSQPVLLKSITALSRYEAASGTFQVVVDLSQHSLLPGFLQGSETLFIGQGTDIAFVNFSRPQGPGDPGVGEPLGGDGHAAARPARTRRPQRPAVLRVRAAAGPAEPDR